MLRSPGWFVVLILSLIALPPLHADAPKLELRKGDHVCLIGNTMAERLQHDGWFEAMFQSRFPEHELVFRNLGFSGDEINHRIRSSNFGTPDEWLTRCEADVIFAFFGYNESWKGEAGLAGVKQELDGWIKHTLGQKYNGESAPRIVVVGPALMLETRSEQHAPDRAAINQRLRHYAAAMAEVCDAASVQFVDLTGLKLGAAPPLSSEAAAAEDQLDWTGGSGVGKWPQTTIDGLHAN